MHRLIFILSLTLMMTNTLKAQDEQVIKAKMTYLKALRQQVKLVVSAYNKAIRNAEVSKNETLLRSLRDEKDAFLKISSRNKAEIISLSPLNAKYKSLVDMKPLSKKIGHFSLMVNQTPNGRTPTLGTATCYEFLYAHASSRMKYKIPRGAKYFQAKATSLASKSITFEVLVGGKRKFKSKSLSLYNSGYIDIKIKLKPSAHDIELITDSMGDADSDWSVWCLPRFVF